MMISRQKNKKNTTNSTISSPKLRPP